MISPFGFVSVRALARSDNAMVLHLSAEGGLLFIPFVVLVHYTFVRRE